MIEPDRRPHVRLIVVHQQQDLRTLVDDHPVRTPPLAPGLPDRQSLWKSRCHFLSQEALPLVFADVPAFRFRPKYNVVRMYEVPKAPQTVSVGTTVCAEARRLSKAKPARAAARSWMRIGILYAILARVAKGAYSAPPRYSAAIRWKSRGRTNRKRISRPDNAARWRDISSLGTSVVSTCNCPIAMRYGRTFQRRTHSAGSARVARRLTSRLPGPSHGNSSLRAKSLVQLLLGELLRAASNTRPDASRGASRATRRPRPARERQRIRISTSPIFSRPPSALGERDKRGRFCAMPARSAVVAPAGIGRAPRLSQAR